MLHSGRPQSKRCYVGRELFLATAFTLNNKSRITRTASTVLLKHFVGGFGPHFVDACKPDIAQSHRDAEQGRYWLEASACTRPKHIVNKA
jgi:hypothetical protein